MADTKISALTALTTIADEDLIAVVDDPGGTPTTKKITKANLVKDIDYDDIKASARSGSDVTLVTGTAGTSGNCGQWNIDGDLVDGKALPTGDIVGSSDTQTLTNKTINTASNTITINEADISDLGSYITASSTDTLTNKTINTVSNTITINEADISDLGSYITASSTDTLTNKTFDASGIGNSLSNVAPSMASSTTGTDTSFATGTAGTDGNVAKWDINGDLVDGPTAPTGSLVGDSDTQTLTNKTINTASNTITVVEADISDLQSYITDVVSDTTPQLGGNLDVNGNSIVSASAGNIAITPDTTGSVVIDGLSHPQADGNANEVLKTDGLGQLAFADPTTLISAASDSTAGKVELATTAETDTGTDTGRAVTPDGLAGSNFGEKAVSVQVFDGGTDVATGDGKAYFMLPSSMDGMDLVGIEAAVVTAGTTGTTDIQIHNVTDAVDVLSTKLTIDSAETSSTTAATDAVINATNDDVDSWDVWRIDVDAVQSGTAPQGLIVTLVFRLP